MFHLLSKILIISDKDTDFQRYYIRLITIVIFLSILAIEYNSSSSFAQAINQTPGSEIQHPVKKKVESHTQKEPKPDSKLKAEVRRQRKEKIHSHYKSGRRFYSEGRYQEAINQFQEVLRLEPKHRRATAYIKKSKRAMELEGKKQRQTEEKIIAIYSEGRRHYREGKYEQAIEEFCKALALNSRFKGIAEYIQAQTEAGGDKRAKGGMIKGREEIKDTEDRIRRELQRARSIAQIRERYLRKKEEKTIINSLKRLYGEAKRDLRKGRYGQSILKFDKIIEFER